MADATEAIDRSAAVGQVATASADAVSPSSNASADTSKVQGPSGGFDLARSVGWVLAVVGFIVGARTITDNSFLTHLATGRLILDEGSVPLVDPYSALAAGESWTVQSWLVSVQYALLDSVLGGWAVRAVNGLLGASITLGLWRLVAPARQLITRIALVSLALLIGTSLWPPRPLLHGLLFMVVLLLVVQGHRPRWWLLPLFWFWANSHGSFVLGLVVLGASLIGAAIDERRVPDRELRLVGIAVLGCIAALVNPTQWRILWFPIHMLSRGDALERVSEWGSPEFRSPVEQLFLLMFLLIVVAAARRTPWRLLLPAMVFFVAGVVAVRNLGLASIVIVTAAAPSLKGLVGTVDGLQTGRVPRMVGAVAAIGAVVSLVAVFNTAAVDVEAYPVEEVDWLDDRDLIAEPDVLVAQRDYVGNYLTLRYGRDANVFMDDRFDFYPQQVIEDHNALLLGGDIDEVLERNQFDVLLWATDSPLRRWIEREPDWVIALDDEEWFVACRVESPAFSRCS